ncbi:MOSC domain-containing protein [Glacieibacterium frigidum]|uniref:MOSC domain-containing protein n=1 Tax=Glacieibacterium frigidum TaxID=2593303 RepID=A0A552UHA3_9SPHN|nr:MOSC domain-containing protein [Glacieibacterium frigidum]TRW17604.1 MOSC domain-containing protein [Glacieibacterium frigidum]
MGRVIAVGAGARHGLNKGQLPVIELIAGHGVAGDAHCGERVQHRSRARWSPGLPNLRQVHLLQAELLDELVAAGFALGPIDMGENITTRGVDLLALPRGARLRVGGATVELTGLRNPCVQLERMMPDLMAACLGRDAEGGLVRKAGVMAVVVEGGAVRAGDAVGVTLPEGPFVALKPV